jgi:hypothetical protein
MDPVANPRADPREWRENTKAKDCERRNYKNLRKVEQNVPSRQTGERNILAIFFGPVVLATVMIQMGVVNKRRDQKRNSAQQIPHETERGKFARTDVDQFVNEQRAAIN